MSRDEDKQASRAEQSRAEQSRERIPRKGNNVLWLVKISESDEGVGTRPSGKADGNGHSFFMYTARTDEERSHISYIARTTALLAGWLAGWLDTPWNTRRFPLLFFTPQ